MNPHDTIQRDAFLARVLERRNELGWSERHLLREARLSEAAIKNIRGREDALPSMRTVNLLASALQVHATWLAFGRPPKMLSDGERVLISIEEAESNGSDDTDRRGMPEYGGAYNLGKNGVPEMAALGRLGSGGAAAFLSATTSNGITISEDLIAAEWGIPDSFIGLLRVHRRALRILPVDGDSGYDPGRPDLPGSLFPGDKVFVDTDDVTPSPPGPFALFDGIGVAVKWLDVDDSINPPQLVMISRNPAYSTKRKTFEEIKILGRIRGKITAF